jgi:hypothetical protein
LGLLVIFQYSIAPHPQGGHDILLQSLATSLVEGNGYSSCRSLYFVSCQPGDPSAVREPLPMLLFAAYQILSQQLNSQFLLYIHILFNLLTGMLLFHIAEKLFRDERVSFLVVGVWATYLPIARFAAFYRMDTLLAFLLTLTLFLLIRAVKKPSIWRFIPVGLAFGLTLLTRSVLLYGVILLPLGLYYALRRNLSQTRSRWAVIVLGTGIILLPWVVRNYQVFDDFIPGSTLNGYNILRHNHIIQEDDYLRYVRSGETREYIESMLSERDDIRGDENEAELDRIFTEEALRIIGQYPLRYLHLTLHRFLTFQWFDNEIADNYGYENTDFYHYFVIVNLITLLTLPIGIIRFPRERWRSGWILLAPFALLIFVHPFVVTRFRYIAGAMLYPLMFSAYGVVSFLFPHGQKPRPWAIALAGLSIGVWGVWTAGYLWQTAVVQNLSANNIDITYYQGDLRLVGYELDHDRYSPGDPLALSLYFKIPARLEKTIGLSVHLLDADFKSVASDDISLSTDAWTTNQIVHQPVPLHIPDDMIVPIMAHIQLTIWEFTDGYPPAEISTELTTSEIWQLTPGSVILTSVPILSEEESSQLTRAAAYHVDNAFTLSSYDLPDTIAGDNLPLAFQWAVNDETDMDAIQFVHIFDMSDGSLVSGYDSQPFDGHFPTFEWIAHTQIVDEWSLNLPEGLKAGEYQVFTGFYDAITQARLSVMLDGAPVSNNFIDLGTFSISPKD